MVASVKMTLWDFAKCRLVEADWISLITGALPRLTSTKVIDAIFQKDVVFTLCQVFLRGSPTKVL